jgi:hypothetical protein
MIALNIEKDPTFSRSLSENLDAQVGKCSEIWWQVRKNIAAPVYKVINQLNGKRPRSIFRTTT